MVATGDIRVHEGKQARVRAAAEQMLEAVDVLEGETEPNSPESVEAKTGLRQAVREAMAATGVRQPA